MNLGIEINVLRIFIISGDPQYFFDGDHPGEHTCACGEDNSCLTNGIDEFSCNCDAYFPIVANDTGLITAKNLLPITGVFYGPLMFEPEFASFTVGRLRCRGIGKRHQNMYKHYSSCSPYWSILTIGRFSQLVEEPKVWH